MRRYPALASLALCAGLNNWQQFRQATESATHFTPQRDAMTSLMQKDPDRPWPRSVGHIPLAVPGMIVVATSVFIGAYAQQFLFAIAWPQCSVPSG